MRYLQFARSTIESINTIKWTTSEDEKLVPQDPLVREIKWVLLDFIENEVGCRARPPLVIHIPKSK